MFATSGTIRYSCRVGVNGIGSAVCSKRLTTGAAEPEGVARDALFKRFGAAVDPDHHLKPPAEPSARRVIQTLQIKKQELGRIREQFSQQSITGKTVRRIRKDSLVQFEADLPETLGGVENDRRYSRPGVERAEDHRERVVENDLIKCADERCVPTEVKPQRVDRQLRKGKTAVALEDQSELRFCAGRRRESRREGGQEELSVRQPDGPERDGIGGLKATGIRPCRQRSQAAARGDHEAVGELTVRGIEVELKDRQRGQGREIMRVENPEYRLNQLREFVVDPMMNSPRQERERLDQSLNVRVGASFRLDHQPAGGDRVTLGEFLGRWRKKTNSRS